MLGKHFHNSRFEFGLARLSRFTPSFLLCLLRSPNPADRILYAPPASLIVSAYYHPRRQAPILSEKCRPFKPRPTHKPRNLISMFSIGRDLL